MERDCAARRLPREAAPSHQWRHRAGRIADLTLPHVLAGATHVIVALPDDDTQRDRAILLARKTGLKAMSVPGGAELQSEYGDVDSEAAGREQRP